MRQDRQLIQVSVFDAKGNELKTHVALRGDDQGGRIYKLEFDDRLRSYTASEIAPGSYLLTGQADGYVPDERRVTVHSAGLREILVLGQNDWPFMYRGAVKTPFEPKPELVALALVTRTAARALRQVEDFAREQHLTAVDIGAAAARRHVYVYEMSAKGGMSQEEVIEKLRHIEGVGRAGPLVHFEPDKSLSFLTDEFVIKFRSGLTPRQMEEIVRKFELTKLRGFAHAPHSFLFRFPGAVGYEMLRTAAKVVKSGLVEYAEPNLISTALADSSGGLAGDEIRPSDFLFPMQWHLRLIRCPQAWRLMHEELSSDRAMGSPDITIAVVDWGIDIDHPEFAGKLSNGQTKVLHAFDFHNMAPNNDGRAHGHGTACASVASALPNNGGVCGVAGNCRLMAIRRPEGHVGSETAYSDMYLWIAGFDPGSPVSGFPKRIASSADVISNSFGHAAGLPISGLMKDTFDFLTDRGRNGRGVLLVFSAGNTIGDFTLERPWAAYERTFSVMASTLVKDGINEIYAKNSGFGPAYGMLDCCAPSASSLGAPYNPPESRAIVTAADRYSTDPDRNLQPNAPSNPAVRTTAVEEAQPAQTTLRVVSTRGFDVGQFVLIGTPENEQSEFNQIAKIASGTVIELTTPLNNSHPPGTPITGGFAGSLHSFSGTSCATAIAAGVGALVLSARPDLTWQEVRDLLRGTAVKIDPHATDRVSIWRNVNGVAYSARYGFGRVDALAAIEAALRRLKSKVGGNPRSAVRTVAPETHDADNPHRNS